MRLTAADAERVIEWLRDRHFGRLCAACGRRFKPRRPRQRYCSLACLGVTAAVDPTPEEIEKRAAEVRAKWTAEDEMDRRSPCFKTKHWMPPTATVSQEHHAVDAT